MLQDYCLILQAEAGRTEKMPLPGMSEKSTFGQKETNPVEDALRQRQGELAALVDRLTGADGTHRTDIAPLTLYRLSAPSPPVHGLQKPTFCMAVQGCKLAVLGENTYLHDPADYLLVSVSVPIVAQVVEASPTSPYLGFCLDLDPRQVGMLLMEMNGLENPARDANTTQKTASVVMAQSLSVSRTDAALLDAVIRLLRLLDTPRDIPVLAPLAVREILYRLLTGEQGVRLRQIALDNSPTQRIVRAIDWMQRHYAEPLSIETLARHACMSVSGLHHHFKAVTALSPLQYQKHLRLQEARRLMLYETADAATVAYRVGYNSASQFSREYSRLFGAPPLRDLSRFRDTPPGDSARSVE